MSVLLLSFASASVEFYYSDKDPYAQFDYILTVEQQQKVLGIQGTYGLYTLPWGETIVYIQDKSFNEDIQKTFIELDGVFTSPPLDDGTGEKTVWEWVQDLLIFMKEQIQKNDEQAQFNAMVCQHPDFKLMPECQK